MDGRELGTMVLKTSSPGDFFHSKYPSFTFVKKEKKKKKRDKKNILMYAVFLSSGVRCLQQG